MGKLPASIGLPMLVVVFMSICLCSFSGISYSIARNSMKISKQVEERLLDYQNACNEAERTIAEMESIPEGETTISVPFGVLMENLEVTIESNGSDNDYRITSWKVTETSAWEAPDTSDSADDMSDGENRSGPQGPASPDEDSKSGPQGPVSPGGE